MAPAWTENEISQKKKKKKERQSVKSVWNKDCRITVRQHLDLFYRFVSELGFRFE